MADMASSQSPMLNLLDAVCPAMPNPELPYWRSAVGRGEGVSQECDTDRNGEGGKRI